MKKITVARLFQLLFLLAFLVLFVRTEYRGSDTISAAVNSLFRMDPLVAASYLAATRSFTWLLVPALVTVVATLLLGRFFCGWICPLGTVLDLVTGKIAKTAPIRALKGNLKYWLLLPVLVAALVRINLAGVLDPFGILVRALTFFVHPIIGDAARSGWVSLYRLLGERRDHLAPAYELLRDNLLPFRETFYPLAFISVALFGLIIFLERYESRNWCRNLCPLGTLLGLLSRYTPFKRTPAALCSDCKACRALCPTSFDEGVLKQEECILCMECQKGCRFDRVRFPLAGISRGPTPYLPERRVLLGGVVGGFFLAGSFRYRSPESQPRLLRPPGVLGEDDFLKKCVRCGECMKVCLKGALYPAVAQAGLEGIFTPVVVPRLGYCEYNCTLCGQVCPTGAIPALPVAQKKRAVIGKAVFDKNHCLPFARKTNCIVCEEHCPMQQKAIRSEKVVEIDPSGKRIELQKPYVVDELCNGCGICENVCPLEGKAGIEVFAVKERKPLAAAALTQSPGSGAAPGADPYQ
ncbi:4Fe-4S binding protein [Geomesophilobacter sediminis]|uniref:4Fe-4S binding protein n=1 Tax=Geomesophilobacter sediminis TaxID=2798584 RepID=A0A8J7LVC3_9BACT|nr:4Fe-4S binding protein [Geomesophilobacter sediminis]MBJ6725489.1 4Fe-4S binding protein [Geomesophilobacter sediminis]